MLPLKECIFSEEENQTPIKTDGLGDLAFQNAFVTAFQNAFVTVSSEFCIQNCFKAAV